MCIFIHAAVPKDTDIERLSPVFKNHGWKIIPAENTHLQKQLPEDTVLRLTRECDCSTVLGHERPEMLEDPPKQPVDEAAQYRKKGWSQAKIDRAMAAKAQHKESQTKPENREMPLWIAFIEEVLQQKAASKFGLLFHMFKGSLVDDKIHIRRVETNSTKNLEWQLAHMEEDSLYWFKLK